MDTKDVFKQKLKEKGLPESLAELFQVSKPEDIDGVITTLNGLIPQQKPISNFDELIASNKDFQAEFDRRITKAIETRKEKIKLEVIESLKGTKQEQAPKTTENMTELTALQEQIKQLTQIVSNVVGQTEKQNKLSEAKEKFSKSKLPAHWINRVDVTNKEKNIDDQIKELQLDFDEIRQSTINEAVKNGEVPPVKTNGVISDTDLTAYIESKKVSANEKTENSSIIKYN
jgi:hypothetical protein